MTQRERPGGNRGAMTVGENVSGMVPPQDDTLPIFDVVSGSASRTRYVPSAELAAALNTAGDWWQQLARQAIVAMAETHETFTIDDLRDGGLVPDPVNPGSAWGAAVSGAANSGLITCVGYRKSRRKAAHSRVVSVWTKAR